MKACKLPGRRRRQPIPSPVKITVIKRLFSICLAVTLELVLASCANDSSTRSGFSELLAAGDIADCSSSYSDLTAGIIEGYPDATVATLGDNAYGAGSKEEFECYDKTWGKFKNRTRPSAGNHDYGTANAEGYFDYFDSRAGDPDKGYYTYQLGSWSMIALNSNCDEIGGCGPDSPQYRWLKKSLSQSQARCTLAYMHHPWRSSGKHGPTGIIEPLVELLYKNGADVVLSGHDHIYERFAPQRPDGRVDNQRGMRQFVVGTGGNRELYDIQPIDNSETRNNEIHGVLKLSLNKKSYKWEFLGVREGFVDKGEDDCR